MRRQTLNKIIGQLFLIDLLIGLIAYWLQSINEQFTWVFVGSAVLLFWFFVAGVFANLEALVHNDEA